jgi:type IV secretion system protein VirD4
LSPKYDLRKHPNFKYTGEANKSNAFDPAKLISTKLTVAPNDLFTVYNADEVDEDTDGDEDILGYDESDPDAL